MTAMKVIVATIALMAAIIAYAWFLASITPDERSEKNYKSYLRYKKRKEEDRYEE